MSGGHQKFSELRALIALCCCIALGAQAETFSAKVIVVMDGDTVMVLRNGQKLKVRLANIDAPEKDQPFGKQSRDSLLEMVGKKQVQIDSQAVDQYGRTVGLISVDGGNVNQEQVKRGMAWAAEGWHKSRRAVSDSPEGQPSGGVHSAAASARFNINKIYTGLQNDARQARRGLWTQTHPQAPWLWRKQHPSVTPARLLDASSPAATVTLSDMECGKKRRCSQMVSCDEAYFYFTRCGVKTLDGNHDGEPCESLCGGK
jgi:endonuclease YncB( thermonuclease family)